MLGGVWKEAAVRADPLTHLSLGVCSILEVSGSRVDIRQRNYGIGWRPPTS
jgi:hypothetical protein